jgi:hypothetical protein
MEVKKREIFKKNVFDNKKMESFLSKSTNLIIQVRILQVSLE